MPRKRARQEMEATLSPAPASAVPQVPETLVRLRNMWEFSNLVQYIYNFCKAVKIDENIDVEELEMDCLKPQATLLPMVGLALLKYCPPVKKPSVRGVVTLESFDECARDQYLERASERNPFDEKGAPPKNFADFDVFTKIKVLQQLTQWTLIAPERIRAKMDEQKDTDQTIWRIEPFGWDADERSLFVLDDNRLYRMTDAPPAPPPARQQKKNTKKAKAGSRASKRRRITGAADSDAHEDETADAEEDAVPEYDGLGGARWECIAVTLPELQIYIESIAKSRDANERILRKRLTEELLPLLEKAEESRKRKELAKQKELANLEKLAHAKRSSRIASKQEREQQEREAREAEEMKQAELMRARKEMENAEERERLREKRMETREQRAREREARKILSQHDLAELSEDSKKLESGESRLSERRLKAEMERKKRELEELAADDEDWEFDCICGIHGKVDDGYHQIQCEKCEVWQHSKCAGVTKADADREDFHFVCSTCTKREEKSGMTIKLKPRPSMSAETPQPPRGVDAEGHMDNDHGGAGMSPQKHSPSTQSPFLNGSTSSILPPSHTQAFSSPAPHSPVSLPPPPQPHNYLSISYATVPGHSSQDSINRPLTSSRPLNIPNGPSNIPSTPALPSTSQRANGVHPTSSVVSDAQRRPSLNLGDAPVLTPSPHNQRFMDGSRPPSAGSHLASSPLTAHAPTPFLSNNNEVDPSQASVLPDASSGVSPTKHSPPTRPSTANGELPAAFAGTFGSTTATPHVLPPVAALSPSQKTQNLSPPVKHAVADPEAGGQMQSSPIIPRYNGGDSEADVREV